MPFDPNFEPPLLASGMPEVTCGICQETFDPGDDERARYYRKVAEGATAWIVKCPLCEMSTVVRTADQVKARDVKYRCPEVGCDGHVMQPRRSKSGEGAWLCGECGQDWPDLTALEKAIDAIVARFAYRKTAYRKQRGRWLPGKPEREASDFDERVSGEDAQD